VNNLCLPNPKPFLKKIKVDLKFIQGDPKVTNYRLFSTALLKIEIRRSNKELDRNSARAYHSEFPKINPEDPSNPYLKINWALEIYSDPRVRVIK